ncbi:MAG TPA: RluA family pseudouridine synthase, partial [Candidatus Ventrimonas merdavium]|nr:RluA family pseudouridine synthase [Candidatus Ventrimonas merdavium]
MKTRRQFSYPVIPDGTPCPTVRELLASQGYSRQLMIRIKQAPGGLMADGKPVPINQVLSPGQILTVNLPPEAPSWAVTPAPLPLDIIYEDEDLL